MKIVFVSQGPLLQPSSAPFRLLRNYAFKNPAIAETCTFEHFPVPAMSTAGTGIRLESRASDAELYSLSRRIIEAEPDVLALSLYCWNTSTLLGIARFCKAARRNLVVVAGGPDVYGRGKALLEEHAFLDFAIDSEGEYPFARLVELLAKGEAVARPPSPGLVQLGRGPGGGLERIPFLSYRSAGAVHRADGEFFIENLDEIPSPILSAPRHELVTRFSGREGDAVIVETSRGCPVNCAFCQYPKNDGGRMRYFSVERVLAELEYLRSLDIRTIYFGDGIFTIRKDRAERFFQYFIDDFKEATIHVELKLDMIPESLLPYVRLLVEQGRLTVGVGIQSVNMATLDRIGRPTKLHLLERSIDAIGSARTMRWDLIYGLPGDRLKDLVDGLELAYARAPGARVCMQPLQVLPGTDMWNKTEQYGLIHERANPYHMLCSDTFSFEDVRRAELMSELYALFGGPFQLAASPAPHGWGLDLRGMWHELFDEEMCAALHDGPRTPETMVRFVERLKRVCASRLSSDQHAAVVEAIEWILLTRMQEPASFAQLAELTDQFRSFVTRASVPTGFESGAADAPVVGARLAYVLDRAYVFRFNHPFHELESGLGHVLSTEEGFTWVHTGDRTFTLAPDALGALGHLRGGDTTRDWAERLVASDPSWEGVELDELDTLLRLCARDRVVTLEHRRADGAASALTHAS